MLKIVPSNQFKKDLKLAKKRGCKIERLREIVNTLANEQKLDKKFRDHGLTGNYDGFRECHVEPDWLLIYRVYQGALELFLITRHQRQGFLNAAMIELLPEEIWSIRKVYKILSKSDAFNLENIGFYIGFSKFRINKNSCYTPQNII